jgi:cytochrome c peroxidase
MRKQQTILISATVVLLACYSLAGADDTDLSTPQLLGQALFHDKNLSFNRTQACSTCHMPDQGFSDHNEPGGAAVSRGDDMTSLGDRNAPSVTYARFSPPFHKDAVSGEWTGGQFVDGRASTLEDQAGGPPLNPVEMGMPDKETIRARIVENTAYVSAFRALYGDQVLETAESTFTAMTGAIAAFERTDGVSPFDSRYDRYLRGEITFTDQEELGRTLFFSTQFTNCNLCHDLKGQDGRYETSTFSGYKYFNIGVPENEEVRRLNGLTGGYRDPGLAANPSVSGDSGQNGKFKVPSLRNVAVTGPYMHNGVFKDLRTVVLFYNHYNAKSESSQTNPETGKLWGAPEVTENLATKELETGPSLKAMRVDALVAFLKTLTDRRYEHLLQPDHGAQP